MLPASAVESHQPSPSYQQVLSQNIAQEVRHTDGRSDRAAMLANELVRLGFDVISYGPNQADSYRHAGLHRGAS